MRNILKLNLAAAGAMLCLTAPAGQADAAAPQGEPKVLTQVNGRSLDDLVMSWLHWVGEEAPEIFPDEDKTGKGCSYNQAGSVWYLMDNYTGKKVTRYCVIPEGKYIFVPVAVSSATNHLGWEHCGEMLRDGNKSAEKAVHLTLEVDGKKLKNFRPLRADSQYCSGLSLESAVQAPGTYAAAGYWAVLPPLPAGNHTIRFGGDMPAPGSDINYAASDDSSDSDDSGSGDAGKNKRKPGEPAGLVEYQIKIVPDSNPDIQLLTKADGKDLSELAAAWGDWVMTPPAAQDLRADKTGQLCALNQKGKVWYLSDAYYQFNAAPVSRKCSLPHDKYILVPVAHKIQQRNGAEGGYCDLLQKSVRKGMDGAVSLKMSVDGRNFGDFKLIRAASKDCLRQPNGAGIYAIDGYWALVPPLSKGAHTISFSSKLDGGPGRDTAAKEPIKPIQSMAVTYKLNVE